MTDPFLLGLDDRIAEREARTRARAQRAVKSQLFPRTRAEKIRAEIEAQRIARGEIAPEQAIFLHEELSK